MSFFSFSLLVRLLRTLGWAAIGLGFLWALRASAASDPYVHPTQASFERVQLDVSRLCDGYFRELWASYGADERDHVAWTGGAIHFLSRQPVGYLGGCQDALESSIASYGIDPTGRW